MTPEGPTADQIDATYLSLSPSSLLLLLFLLSALYLLPSVRSGDVLVVFVIPDDLTNPPSPTTSSSSSSSSFSFATSFIFPSLSLSLSTIRGFVESYQPCRRPLEHEDFERERYLQPRGKWKRARIPHNGEDAFTDELADPFRRGGSSARRRRRAT